MKDNTVSIHKVIKATPEKVYKAFTDSLAFSNWLPPYGYLCSVQQFDLKVGGTYKMTFTNFTTRNSHSFGGTYLEIEPNKFLKYSDKINNPDFPEEMITSVWLTKVSCGTELRITQENIPKNIPVEMCYLGWQDSIDKLTKLVEPEIQDV